MKLYTEEQVVNALNRVFIESITIEDVNEVMRSLTPIELPSDEELKKQFDVHEFDPYDLAYLGGAIWMRNKIQGGNK